MRLEYLIRIIFTGIVCIQVPLVHAQKKDIVLQKIRFAKISNHSERHYHLDKLFIRDINKKYRSKIINGKLISDIIKEVTNEYVSNGFITSRAFIQEQDISLGILTITVVEGYISDVVIKNKNNSNVKNGIFTLINEGKTLNLRDIEQDLDHYNRLNSKKASFKIEPGEDATSSRVIITEDTNKKWFLASGIDNDGSKSKGKMQWHGKATFEDIFSLRETISVFHKRTLDDKDKRYSHSYVGSVSIPFYYSTIDVNANRSFFRNYVHTKYNSYSFKGNSKGFRVSCDYVLHRNGNSKSSVITAYAIDEYNNYLANNRIDISSYLIRKVELGTQHQRVIGNNIVGANITGTYGENLKFLGKNLKDSIYDKNFAKFSYRFTLLRPLQIKIFNKPAEYQAQFFGQIAVTPLVGSEKGVVGGLNSVRGYKENIESADTTGVLRNDLTLRITDLYSDKIKNIIGEPNLFIALDIGRFKNREIKGYRYGTLSGVAAGIKNRSGTINYSLTIARAMENDTIHNKISSELYFNIGIDV